MILQQTADLHYIPQRIVSLVPSQTELLCCLGLEAETAGITKFCVHPESWFTSKEKVGGTKTVNIHKIHQLKPDLIIANKEENVKEQIEQLAADYPVWLTDVNSLADALQMIAKIGTLTGKLAFATALINNISEAFKELRVIEKPVKTAYLIWRKPYMTIGGDTFIHDMMQKCGFENIFSDKTRYPEINITQLQQPEGCQLLLLSSEPYPFKQKHLDELQGQLPEVKIMLVDGEFFSWYGSRLLQSANYFKQLITQITGI
jgi:ABC-type Fe3+-hydroxamate transport system substrate-binding protein